MYLAIKFLISALLVVLVSEVSRRSGWLGGLLASLPVTSIQAMLWLHWETKDTDKISTFSTSVVWFLLPTFLLFILLPQLLKRGMGFYPALAISSLATMAAYALMLVFLPKTAS